MGSAVIVDAVRTPSGRGKPGGALAEVHPAELLAQTLRALVQRNDLDADLVDDVIGGCVGQSGDQALNVTRTAALSAGFPESVPATTVDRQCGSSQQAVAFAAQGVMAGVYEVVVAAGVESMSRVPIGAPAVGGDPLRPLLWRYPQGLVDQGVAAELVAARWKLDRAALDEYAVRSHQRAADAAAGGAFAAEIVPVELPSSSGCSRWHTRDETIRPATTAERLSQLPSSFFDRAAADRFPDLDWSITAGNSSPLTDGASAALIMADATAERLGLRPRARFSSFAIVGSDPLLMLTGVIPATQRVLARSDLTLDDIDVYEVNEAFAPVPLAWQRELNADPAKLNPNGGAIALGHPLGASGIRLLATMLHWLEATGQRYGLQTMCEGGGMANAMIIERL